jgi:hypothetical protein
MLDILSRLASAALVEASARSVAFNDRRCRTHRIHVILRLFSAFDAQRANQQMLLKGFELRRC